MKTKFKRSPGRKEIELISGENWAPIPNRQEEGLSKLPEAFYASTAKKPIIKTPDGEVLPDRIVKRIPRDARGRATLRAVPQITTVEGMRLEIVSLELHRANFLPPLVRNTLRR